MLQGDAKTRPFLSKHHTTPVSSVGSNFAQVNILNPRENAVEGGESTRPTIGMILNDSMSHVGMAPKSQSQKQCPVNTVEFPEICPAAKRRALGNSFMSGSTVRHSEKKLVTFSEGLPVIKGNSIHVSKSSESIPTHPSLLYSSTTGREFVRSEEVTKLEDEFLKPPWSAPITNRSSGMTSSKSRLYAPLPLPKIDIVSEIYDELIVKTIQNYLLAEGYSKEKFQALKQTLLARLSATYPHLVKHKVGGGLLVICLCMELYRLSL